MVGRPDRPPRRATFGSRAPADRRVRVLVDLPGDIDPTCDTVDVGPAQLQQLALPQADERGEHDEQLQPIGHPVDDDGELSSRYAAALVDSVEASSDARQALISERVTSRSGISPK